MHCQEDVSAALDVLKFGLGGKGCESALNVLRNCWADAIGSTNDEIERGEQWLLFYSEVSGIRFRGMGELPILVVGEDSPNLPTVLSKFVQRTRSGRLIGVALCMTTSGFSALRTSSLLPAGRCLILSREDVKSILTNANPIRRFRKYLLNQFPRKKLIPFTTSHPAEGAMFVGRKDELEKLTSLDQDFALCGPGGIGKSSLLRQMRRKLRHDRDERYSRLVDVELLSCPRQLDAACREIAMRILPRSFCDKTTLANFETTLRRIKWSDERFKDAPVELVIDEMDGILSIDRNSYHSGKYPLMRILCRARRLNLIRLTISGREETKKLLADPDNPFVINSPGNGRNERSRIKLVCMSTLQDSEAEELLLEPLRDVDYDVDTHRDELLAELRRCNGVPFYIQDLGLDIAIEGEVAGSKLAFQNSRSRLPA